jgi:hypothetical protein
MQISTLWKLILKGIGLFLLVKIFEILPALVTIGFSFSNVDSMMMLQYTAYLVFYPVLSWLLLFREDVLIKQLKLEKGFSEKYINITYPSDSVLRIIIIIIAALELVDDIPGFVMKLTEFMQQSVFLRHYKGTGYLIYLLIKIVLLYLAITNNGAVAKWITQKAGPAKNTTPQENGTNG